MNADTPGGHGGDKNIVPSVAAALAIPRRSLDEAPAAALEALAVAAGQHGAALLLPDDASSTYSPPVLRWGRSEGTPVAVPVRREGELRGVVELYGDRAPTAVDLPLACALVVETFRHHRLEQRLVENQRRQRLLAEAAFEGILVHDGQSVIEANQALATLLGTTRDKMLGRSLWDFADPESRDQIAAHIRQGYQGTYRTQVLHSDGERIPVELQTRELRVGSHLHRVVAFRDIRERLRAEQIQREGEQRLRSLLELTYDGVTVARVEDGVVLEANQGFADLFGYTLEECIGMVPGDVATPESTERIRANMRAGHQRPYEMVGIRKDGTRFPVEILGQSTTWQGQPVRITGFRDLTEQRSREATREHLEAQVRHAQKLESLGVMAGGVAHDFNNLLAVVLGNAELAGLALESGADPRPHLDAIQTAASRASQLTGQLLAYTGSEHYDARPLTVEDLLRDIATLLEVAVPKKVRLELDFAPDTPVVRADPGGLQQVMLNLITNAAEAIGDRPGTVRVRSRAHELQPGALGSAMGAEAPPTGPCLAFSVQDDGEGMSPEVVARIFDPFFTTKFTGRGLGLAAVLGIVRSHGGAVTVDSRPGQGTTFTVYLPAVDAQPSSSTPDRCRAASWRGQGLALLADDEPAVRGVTSAMLERLGLQVQVAEDGSAAVRLVWAEPDLYRVVIVDMNMPGLSGGEVLAHLRRRAPRLPVLLVSGYDRPEGVGRHDDDPALAFLHKPFSLRQLQDALGRLLPSD